MSKYNSFLTIFIISVVAMIVFIVFYFQSFFGLVSAFDQHEEPNPIGVFSTLFSPPVIISGLVFALSSLAFRIQGIVYVARNKNAGDGEKALWIIGFIMMGFVTAIVFLIMAKGRKFVE